MELPVTSSVEHPANAVLDTPPEKARGVPSTADRPAPKAAEASLGEEPLAVRRWFEAVDPLLWMLATMLAIR